MDISEVMRRFNNTKPEDWRPIKNAWVHRDCFVGKYVGICGGVFRHGTFHSGVFYDGTFRGGRFYAGTFYGGVFRGGVFHSGTFKGGTFNGGTFNGGTFNGGVWNRSPLFIQGTQYPVCESDNGYIASGCMRMPSEWWTTENITETAREHSYTDEQIIEYLQIFELVKSQMELTGPVVD